MHRISIITHLKKLLKEQKTLKINAPFPSLCLIKKLQTLLTASGNKHPCFGIFPMDINYITGLEQHILQMLWTMSKTGTAYWSGSFWFVFFLLPNVAACRERSHYVKQP